MKHLVILPLFTFHFSLFTLSASAAVPLKWTVETSRLAPAVFDVVRGETIALEAAFNSAGKPFAMDGESVSIFWQTNGMGNAWWTAPAVATSNLVRATFTPEMDPGAATVNGFLGSSGSIYRAAFTFRFRHGPGAVPNTLPLPVPVIDFAKVRVINPPWSGGGGGGVDTNAVRDIIREQLATNGIRSVDGSARPLPRYLHALDFDDTYPADAAWYYAQPQDYGSCSAVRSGGFLCRNYDWKFDAAAEFVVRMTAGEGRFASVGVANVGTNLTEATVTSGKWSRYYKCLPGRVVDGINSEGVVCEVNVVDGDPHEAGWPTNGTIHCLGAVRWVLDHATNAASAASVLATEVYFPSGWTQNFHYMVCDERETWIVENCSANDVTDGVKVLTNFRLYPTRDTTGEGQERYDALASGENITNAWYTRAYRRETTPPWVSDLADVLAYTNEIYDAWASHDKEYFRGKTNNGIPWWQTVHTSVYDITNRTIRICVQENPDWYTFAVPSASGVKPEAVKEIVTPMIGAATNGIPEQIASLQSGKRDIDDLGVYEPNNVHWTWTAGYNCPPGWVEQANAYGAPKPRFMGLEPGQQYYTYWYCDPIGGANCEASTGFYAEGPEDATSIYFTWYHEGLGRQFNATVTRASATDTTPVKVDDLAIASQLGGKVDKIAGKGLSSNDFTDADKAEVAKVKDKADEFTEWVPGTGAPDTLEGQPYYEYGLGFFVWDVTSGINYRTVACEEDESSVEFFRSDSQQGQNSFTATRKRVLRTGDAATPQELTNAISTNNPAFVSAVRSLIPTTLRAYDPVRQCWWNIQPVNGVLTLTVED